MTYDHKGSGSRFVSSTEHSGSLILRGKESSEGSICISSGSHCKRRVDLIGCIGR